MAQAHAASSAVPGGHHPVGQAHGRAPRRPRPARPVRIRSRARPSPTMRGRRTVPPSTRGTPKRRQNTPKTASSAATRRSHQTASSRPPATAWPSTAAMTGFDSAEPGGTHRTRSVLGDAVAGPRRHGLEVGAGAERPAGAGQDGDGGTGVGVERLEGRRAGRSAVGRSTALRRAGRSMVTTVTGPVALHTHAAEAVAWLHAQSMAGVRLSPCAGAPPGPARRPVKTTIPVDNWCRTD